MAHACNLACGTWYDTGIDSILCQEKMSMATYLQKVGEKVKKIRNKAGFSQEELAAKAKLDPKSIVELEQGQRNPKLMTVKKVSLALKVKLSELLD